MHIIGFLRSTKLTFIEKRHESGDIYSFYFKSSKPLKHIAGQHGLFVLPRLRGLHIFSLSSAPEEKYVAISTHVRQKSAYKQHLDSLNAGDHIRMWGPVLDFIFKKDVSNYVFLAQGIGITPFRSLLVHANKARLPISTTLIHVDSHDHTFQDETKKLASHAYYPNDPEDFTQTVKTLTAEADYYLSGSPKFVKATKLMLKSQGVKRTRINSDTFLGY